MRKTCLFMSISLFLFSGVAQGQNQADSVSEGIALGDTDRAKILLDLEQVSDYGKEIVTAIKELVDKAVEKKNIKVKECLMPHLNNAEKLYQVVENLRKQTITKIAANDFIGVFQNLKDLSVIKKAFEKLYEKALACLTSDFLEGVAKVIPPDVVWETEGFSLPDFTEEMEIFISIYR